MKKLPIITLENKFHRNNYQILFRFSYNSDLIDIAKSIKGANWSITLKSWYIKNNPENLKLLYKVFANLAIINGKKFFVKPISAPKKPIIKRIRNLTTENKLLLNNFYKYLKGKRYSQSTLNTYSYIIADFIEFNQNKLLNTLTNKDVELFIETIFIKRRYSISTQRQFISALKLFIVFYPETQINNLELTRPSKSKILPTVLSQEEMINILRVTNNLKHRAVLALIYSSGLRISELLNLKLEHLQISRKQLLIKNSKGRKDRYVTIAESFIPLLHNYLLSYEPKIYFVEGKKGGKYSASSVRKFLGTACKIANIKSTVTPHTLRHSYATHLLESGVGLRHIQELLGHSKPETTMIYTHVARKDLLEIKSPLDSALEQILKTQKGEQKFLISRDI